MDNEERRMELQAALDKNRPVIDQKLGDFVKSLVESEFKGSLGSPEFILAVSNSMLALSCKIAADISGVPSVNTVLTTGCWETQRSIVEAAIVALESCCEPQE